MPDSPGPALPPALQSLAEAAPAIAMLAVFALAWGGIVVLRRGDRQKGALMLACALVVFGNVLLWTL